MIVDPPSLKSAMTPFPYSVTRDAPAEEALQLMQDHDVHHLPVTDGQEIVGLVTSRDLSYADAYDEAKTQQKVKKICAQGAYVVDLNEPIENVLLTMAERHLSSAIVTRHTKLAGIFTWVDACRCFAEFLRARSPQPGGDAA